MILRSCTMNDLTLLERWDPRGEMWPGDKQRYLKARVSARDFRMYIGEHGPRAVAWGQIKIERRSYVLSWFVSPLCRRRGFGLQMSTLLALMAGRPARARINTDRPYSERLAIRIGMVTDGKLLISGEKWWVLK